MGSEIEDFVRDGVYITDTTQYDAVELNKSVILYNKVLSSALSENRELSLAMHKRFKGKSTRYGRPTFENLIIWCISTDGYKICEDNLENVSNDDVMEAWGFIDTFRTSSTDACKDIVSEPLGTRSIDDFRRTHAKNLPRRRKDKHAVRTPSGKPRIVNPSNHGGSSHNTINEVITEDLMHMILHSDDEVAMCKKIYETASQGNKTLD